MPEAQTQHAVVLIEYVKYCLQKQEGVCHPGGWQVVRIQSQLTSGMRQVTPWTNSPIYRGATPVRQLFIITLTPIGILVKYAICMHANLV